MPSSTSIDAQLFDNGGHADAPIVLTLSSIKLAALNAAEYVELSRAPRRKTAWHGCVGGYGGNGDGGTGEGEAGCGGGAGGGGGGGGNLMTMTGVTTSLPQLTKPRAVESSLASQSVQK